MIKYLGSKRLLLPSIVAAVRAFEDARSVLDVFSGTSRVGHALKRAGYFVTANDHLAYAATLARCYVEADRDRVGAEAERLLRELANVPPNPGYVTETFCRRSRFFQPDNGAKIDAIRETIAHLDLDPQVEAIALTSLIEAADRVDSTTGVQMAYLKSWAARSFQPLTLRMPDVLAGPGRATRLDAFEAVESVESDVVYLDPPYNQHSYLGNYHIWESIVRWDKPETYGVACKRVDCRETKSLFNSKRAIHAAFERLIGACRGKHLLVSFNNEGYVERDVIEELLRARGYVAVVPIDFKRYVGAQIGIFNPNGQKVGKVSHLRNVEYLFIVSHDRAAVDRAERAVTELTASRLSAPKKSPRGSLREGRSRY